jgi:hypothetical protein
MRKRHAVVPRLYQRAVDEARRETARTGFHDERAEVMQHWTNFHTWIRAPVALAGDVLQSNLRYRLIVSFTRLGDLLGALDRQDLPEHARRRVWIGRTT